MNRGRKEKWRERILPSKGHLQKATSISPKTTPLPQNCKSLLLKSPKQQYGQAKHCEQLPIIINYNDQLSVSIQCKELTSKCPDLIWQTHIQPIDKRNEMNPFATNTPETCHPCQIRKEQYYLDFPGIGNPLVTRDGTVFHQRDQGEKDKDAKESPPGTIEHGTWQTIKQLYNELV